MKKLVTSILCLTMLLAGLAVTALAGPSAQAQGSTSSTGMHTPNWNTGAEIPDPTVAQFNPALGTLTGATITVTAVIETTFDRMSNESGEKGDVEGWTMTKFCTALFAGDCAGSTIGGSAASAKALELEPATYELFPHMGRMETRSSPAPVSESLTGTIAVTGADLAVMTGSGSVPIFCSAVAMTGAIGPGTAGADWRTLAGCSVSVTYQYAGIDIEKTTNGVQADTDAESVRLQEGDQVSWNYIVSNPGTETIVNARVTDNMLGDVCVIDRLEPGQSRNCTMAGVAELGLHRMQATVVGNPEGRPGVDLTDMDPTGYVVEPPAATLLAAVPVPTAETVVDSTDDPQIDIELATNSVDADASSGPTVANGDPVVWTYVVKNTGVTELVDVVVIDGGGNAVCTIGLLGLNQTTECSVTSQATCDQAGRRDASVSGVSPDGVRVNDADPTHWNTGGCGGVTTNVAAPAAVETAEFVVVTPAAPAAASAAAAPAPAEPAATTNTDLPTTLAYTGSESNGPAAFALVASALGLIAFSASEALKRRHAQDDMSVQDL